MPYKSIEAERAYQREWMRKCRLDPEFRLAENKRLMERIKERLRDDPEFRAQRNALHRLQHAQRREHQLAVQRARYARFYAAFVKWRDTLCCQKCQSKVRINFHHRDKTTKVANVSSLAHSPRLFHAEVKKCDILCQNCHQILHGAATKPSDRRSQARGNRTAGKIGRPRLKVR